MKGAVVYAFHLIGKIPVLKVIGAAQGSFARGNLL